MAGVEALALGGFLGGHQLVWEVDHHALGGQGGLEAADVQPGDGLVFVQRLGGGRAGRLAGEDGGGNHPQHVPGIADGGGAAAGGEQVVEAIHAQGAQGHLVEEVRLSKSQMAPTESSKWRYWSAVVKA